jgi:Protein of unknown function (DUF4238)
MTKPKRHHYVPQFLQAPFTGSDGKLFVHRKGTSAGEIFTAGPKDVFLERHLYSSVETNGARIPTQETAYSVLDGAASPIVRKLIDAADLVTLPCLSKEERETWDLFFYQQIKRVPGMIAYLEATRSFADRYKDILADFEAKLGRPLTKAELDEFNSPEFKARVRQNAIVKALADDGKVVQTMIAARRHRRCAPDDRR